jgi:hypothetical protein
MACALTSIAFIAESQTIDSFFSLRPTTQTEKIKILADEISTSSAFTDEQKSLAMRAIEILPSDQAISFLFHRIVTPVAFDGDKRVSEISILAEELFASLEGKDPLIEEEIREEVAKKIEEAVTKTCSEIETNLLKMQQNLQTAIEKKIALTGVLNEEMTRAIVSIDKSVESALSCNELAATIEITTASLGSAEEQIASLLRKFHKG